MNTLEEAEESCVPFIVMATDKGQAEVLVRKYTQREEILKDKIKIREVQE